MKKPVCLFLKKEPLDWILFNRKRLEARLGYPHIIGLGKGDIILFNERYRARVLDNRRYPTFKDALEKEPYLNIIPLASSKEEAISFFEAICPVEKQIELGVHILEFKYPY